MTVFLDLSDEEHGVLQQTIDMVLETEFLRRLVPPEDQMYLENVQTLLRVP